LHTNFQQNKDCNSMVRATGINQSRVAYELPAKQGLQQSVPAPVGLVLLQLHTTFQQNKDCNQIVTR